ncbi:MAG: AAA family ATPase [Armatimonadetes bacterium]|nr:AAA family ATPase [Armatimonadota bacterium]
MADKTRVLITETSPGDAERLVSVLRDAGDFELVGFAQDGIEAAQLAYRLRPDVVVLWQDLAGLRGFEASEVISRCAPEVASVVVLRSPDEQGRRLAQAAGARGVIAADDLSRLPQLLQEISDARAAMSPEVVRRIVDVQAAPVVVAVVGAKGGVGKTTVAVNLAVALAHKGEKVVLVEAPWQLGDAAMFLDVSPAHSFLELAETANLDPDIVEASLAHHSSGVSLLAATTESPSEELPLLSRLNTETLGAVLGSLKRTHSAVVADLPASIWEHTAYVSTRSHVVVVVTTADDVATIRDAATLLDLLAAVGVKQEQTVLVVNRVARGKPLGPDDIVRVTGWEHYLAIPEDEANAAAAINEGVPLVLRTPNSPAARAISKLADDILAKLGRGIRTKTPSDER